MQNKYNEILEKIKSVLQEEDLMGLIKVGAPKDEYDSESLMIFERINRYDSASQIQDKLWDVFYLQFCFGTVYKNVDGEFKEVYKEPVQRGVDAEKIIGIKNKYLSAATKIEKIMTLDTGKPNT